MRKRLLNKLRTNVKKNARKVYNDLRNSWANLRQTFRDCWGKVGDCPRQNKNQKVEHGSCVLATQPYLVSARVTTLSALRTVAL